MPPSWSLYFFVNVWEKVSVQLLKSSANRYNTSLQGCKINIRNSTNPNSDDILLLYNDIIILNLPLFNHSGSKYWISFLAALSICRSLDTGSLFLRNKSYWNSMVLTVIKWRIPKYCAALYYGPKRDTAEIFLQYRLNLALVTAFPGKHLMTCSFHSCIIWGENVSDIYITRCVAHHITSYFVTLSPVISNGQRPFSSAQYIWRNRVNINTSLLGLTVFLLN